MERASFFYAWVSGRAETGGRQWADPVRQPQWSLTTSMGSAWTSTSARG